MRLPTPLLRKKAHVHKNSFGHVLILAGSRNTLGAAALAGLAAMRAGAGLVTIGVPRSLNTILQKKISPVIMTLSLPETKDQTLGLAALLQIKNKIKNFQVVAIGPGLSQNTTTRKLILKLIRQLPCPLVIDADALNALAGQTSILLSSPTPKILTPHPGEMQRLTGTPKSVSEKNRKAMAKAFAKKYHCTLLLKGHRTVIANTQGRTTLNTTGNAGMATAGSGDVLTGIIAALLAQGLSSFDAACMGAFVHGLAGDLAIKKIPKVSLIATDIIDALPLAFKKIATSSPSIVRRKSP